MKICSSCKTEKNLSDYYKSYSANGGYQHACKACQSDRVKRNYRDNPGRYRENQYKRLYNTTSQDMMILLDQQGHVCKLCNTPIDFIIRSRKNKQASACVDHDHITGKIRGLLCSNCNMGIGNLKEDINILEKAIEYLKG